MVTKKPTDLDDIAEAIVGLGTLMDKRFEQVDKRFEQVGKRFNGIDGQLAAMQHEQAEMRACLEKIDSRLLGIESDVKERDL